MFRNAVMAVVMAFFLMLLHGCASTSEGTLPAGTATLSGTVTDTGGDSVANASVILIPDTDINTYKIDILAISAGATDDEPLEDLVNDSTKSYQSATTDANGAYSFSTVTDGNYFVYVKPADSDSGHLPGGSLCRSATNFSGARFQKDIEISTIQSAAATYVGSAACLTCHPEHETIKKTGHFNSLRVPGTNSSLQDVSKFSTFDAGLEKFASGTTIYYYAYDGTRGMDKYKTSETDPGADVSFTAALIKDGSNYKVRLNNVKNPADPNEGVIYNVDLSYGGAVFKQRYITKIGASYYLLPVQFQSEGSESYSPRTRKVWRDYNGSYWYNESSQLFTTPAKSKAFDNNCAGCHFTGFSVTGSDTAGWVASAVSTSGGTIDFSGDGSLREINTGCEVCHGPGSEHVAAGGGGRSIVQPGLLPPEREAMICGRCHSRPKGVTGTEVPVNSDGKMMLPGGSRSEFLANYTNGTQLDAAASDIYTDKDEHSKSHHQQYSDFIRSPMYKNKSLIMTCASCHDPHGNDNEWESVATIDDNAVCTQAACHGDKSNVVQHSKDKIGDATDMGAVCVDCHMPKTAKSGAGRPGNGSYWDNDINSHLFAVPPKTTSIVAGQAISDSLMPLPYTNSCGTCHDSDLSD